MLFVFAALCLSCQSQSATQTITPNDSAVPVTGKVITGAEQLDAYSQKIASKRIALVVNHTALIGKTHLVDTLKARGINIRKAFAPEHGFRGAAPDGEKINDAVDTKTGLPIISLYGANRKPTAEQLADVDIVIFDIQDVGARFYTYISTLHYVMEACAELQKRVIVLDRPNPNGHYVDGPVLDPALKSFVGMHTIPIVHGMTVGELAKLINGEGWLTGGIKCDLEVVALKNWDHKMSYSVPVKPSPNLPNDQAIRLYPSLCLLEGTAISVGRGTEIAFQIIGHPDLKHLPYQFTPKSIPGMSTKPPLEGQLCYGIDLRNEKAEARFNLKYLLDMYQQFPDKEKFFISASFNRLAGNTALQQQIKDGWTEQQIRDTWKKDLDTFKSIRSRYLLYP